jgi:phenylpyruvate tautomerase PptA (4-oxalocrotonate tautomerase family)
MRWQGACVNPHPRKHTMPFVNIKVAGASLAPEQIIRLQAEATRLMAEVMHKKFELTAVLVEQIDAASWTVGPLRCALQLIST